jgi:glycosyltransferase involved in cell wall biosynthesis
LVPYGDVEAFAEKTAVLLKDNILHARMSAAGVAYAGTLTWERCADEMEPVFFRAIDEAKRK